MCRHLLFIFLTIGCLSAAWCPAAWSQVVCSKAHFSLGTILPQQALEMLHKHPLMGFKKILGDGEGLVFESHDVAMKGQSLYHTGSFGENLQFLFVRETLQQIFPKATFLHPSDARESELHKVDLTIRDSAEDLEDGHIVSLEDTGVLEMSILKQANPGRPLPSKLSLRHQYGFRPHQQVVTIYSSYWEVHQLNPIVSHLQASNPDLVMILSTGGSTISKQDWRQEMEVKPEHQALAETLKTFNLEDLSQLLNGSLTSDHPQMPTRPRLIFNDTYGKMPELYALSDLAVILGPINIIEPLAQGTPTVFLKNTHFDYLREMARVAVGTGRGFEMTSLDQFPRTMQLALQSADRPLTPPYLVKDPTGRTPFQNYLDHLYEHLRVRLPGSFPRLNSPPPFPQPKKQEWKSWKPSLWQQFKNMFRWVDEDDY